MRGAFGNPQGPVARVHTGQVIMSTGTKLQNKEHVSEALLRAKFQFPGLQKIHVSEKRGFTTFNVREFEGMVADMWLIPGGYRVKYISSRGLWTSSRLCPREGFHHTTPLLMPTNKSSFLSA
ncbi:60S ribosomal protein L10 [Plecturocebus cupreus]